MSNESRGKVYDLEERTAVFGERIIALCKKARKGAVETPIVNQLVRSGTSIGANYMEANGASSKRDFTNKIFICKKEAQETKHWLRMLASCSIRGMDAEIWSLWKEAQELTLIFQKIAASARASDR
ncbi:MAG: four helix bundle protein [Candidatus Pacebacteria bacterium]|nr:four helix bundle protein [Candidatus Paceibacterota bacterium]